MKNSRDNVEEQGDGPGLCPQPTAYGPLLLLLASLALSYPTRDCAHACGQKLTVPVYSSAHNCCPLATHQAWEGVLSSSSAFEEERQEEESCAGLWKPAEGEMVGNWAILGTKSIV